MFALGIRYLTGYAVATDVSNRERAEWPPHPARVFMALAAAHFETGEDVTERMALEWLETQSPPALMATEAISREVVTHYVPVNDPVLPIRFKNDAKLGAVRAGLAILPQYRSRQPRTFPRVRPLADAVYLVWPVAAPNPGCFAVLDRLCAKVIRIGHSSSLVQMWVESDPPEPNWLPDENGRLLVRVAGEGTLDYLRNQFSIDRPKIGFWQAYRKADGREQTAEQATSLFDSDLMILSLEDGPVVGLESTWHLLTALRDTILQQCDPTPEWVSGHRPDGAPSQEAHLALLPLAFVGHDHADGHLLGVALAFPRKVSPRERGRALRKLLYDDACQPNTERLTCGRLGAWRLVRETRESPPLALQGQTWTGPSCSWATVTPIVLDRHPKADYVKEHARWQQEAAEAIMESCRRQGLPEPVEVYVSKTCSHRGAPRAISGKSGFALMPVKPGQPARQQIHARLRFGIEVEGPLLLGAGRYRGYGLCKPWNGGGR